jgi:legume-like lectin family protein
MGSRARRTPIRPLRWGLVAALAAAAGSLWLQATPLRAATPISYPDFSSVAGLQLNGTAAQNGSELEMTTPVGGEQASAYSTTPVDVTQSFSTSFELSMSNSNSMYPADGIAFLLQSDSISAVSNATLGGAIGYQGISPSLAVEFDIYNGDPGDPGDPVVSQGDDHVGITENGNPDTYLECATVVSPPDSPCTASLPANIPVYGAPVFAWIDYDAGSGELSVYLSPNSTEPASPTLSGTVNLASLLGTSNPTYGGFTAATGSYDAEQDVLSWQLAYAGAPGGSPPGGSPPGGSPPAPSPPANTAPPVVSGAAQVGQTLSATTGTWSNSPTAFAYQWLLCNAAGGNCTDIAGATASTYTLGAGDVAGTLQVSVTASNAGGSAAASSAPTGVVQAPPAVGAAPPALGQTADAAPVSGTVLIEVPGSTTFVPLSTATAIPLGSTIDARAGRLSLTVALPGGASESGQFYGGEFILTQTADGTLVLTLTGGSFAGCPTRSDDARLARVRVGRTVVALRSRLRGKAPRKKPSSVVRQLWGDAHGDYTTKGRYGSAGVSGTIWLTQDRCDGTYVRVTKDSVIAIAYAHPLRRHRITAGHHILLPAPGF